MSRLMVFTGAALLALLSAAASYEIKPKTPDTAFSGKLKPDIMGLNSHDDPAKVGGVFESYLKDFHGVTPQAVQRKFGNTGTAYVTSMTFTAPASGDRGAETVGIYFSTPASGNFAYYITRDLGFAPGKQPTQGEMIQRVTEKYGSPTAIGDGRLYYFYKSGKIVSAKQKYTESSAVDALNAPINPKVAVALSDAGGRGSCIAVLKHIQAQPDKSLDTLLTDSKNAICDGLLDVALTAGTATDRVGKATFTLIDFTRIISAAKIDADALDASKKDPKKSPASNTPRL
ncbi:MAG: hypothetical protein K2W78_09385 [Xanthobacteraceae bacterium]|nr:hypothetical protein [Xanthobacteraceae bacterium]